MPNAPQDDAVRARMAEATRRLACRLSAEHQPRDPDIGAFRRAVAAYVAAYVAA